MLVTNRVTHFCCHKQVLCDQPYYHYSIVGKFLFLKNSVSGICTFSEFIYFMGVFCNVMVGVFFSLSAGLLRQATYSTTRLGVYQTLMDRFTRLLLFCWLLQ